MLSKRLATFLLPLVVCVDLAVYLVAGLPIFASDYQGTRMLQLVLASSLIVSNVFAIHHLVRSRTLVAPKIATCFGLCNLIGLVTWALFYIVHSVLFAGFGG